MVLGVRKTFSLNQRKIRAFLLIVALSLFNTTVAANSVSIVPEPAHYTWSNRLLIQPDADQIRGIGAQSLNPGWAKVYEFQNRDFPPFESKNLAFTHEGDFDGDGNIELASIAAFKRNDGSTGSFIFIAEKLDDLTFSLKNIVEIGEPAQFAIIDISVRNELVVWFCFNCDVGASFEWDKENSLYQPKRGHSADKGY